MPSHNYRLDPALEDGGPTDIVIFIMGPTGAGKSSFINLILEYIGDKSQLVMVGHQLVPCTQVLRSVTIKDQIEDQDAHFLSLTNEYRIVVVDTPGFDDTVGLDYEVLKGIADWYQESCRRKMILGGVIYLHDISQDRFTGTARRNLSTFTHLCNDAVLDKVVLLTTKWSRESGRDFDTRERELKEVHWKDLVVGAKGGASVMRLSDREGSEGQSGWRVIRHILRNLDRRLLQKTLDEAFQTHDSRAKRKSILETEAEKGLRIRIQTALAIREEIVGLEAQAVGMDKDDDIKEKEGKLNEMHQAIVMAWKEIQKPSRAMRKSRSLSRLLDGPLVNRGVPASPQSELKSGDLVLLIAGASGSGRSTFVNALLREVGGDKMDVGDSGSLSSCTKAVQHSMIDLSHSSKVKKGYRIFVVDTPGFNDCDPKRTDSAIMQTILEWLQHWWVAPKYIVSGWHFIPPRHQRIALATPCEHQSGGPREEHRLRHFQAARFRDD
ncbi:hypothetical protein FA13DRAFT_128962 [Coprinellus micaceus]|uniref:Septin-type G domain-containing protein n=1 Tax=Coprinellus micaceus TaxID=71717 RepID=A0A4Y7SI73_COPMI|nr:hypothetical protein FA13DRAFT_128962 [Coprinellus micaceus]